ncbi:RHS repeat domain-containing protein [Shewanella sp.]|uniref:RHS repeat domain-containing protein n=1 Tax=Shewanella sp. TaxID=50422 RepID=UPI004053BE22
MLDSEQGNYTYSIPVASLSSAKSLQFKIRRILEDGSEEPFLSGGIIPVKLSTDDPDSIQTVRYQHTDMLGSVVAESDEAGNILSRSHYEPFGKRLGGDKAGIGYTGHLQDKDLGLTYMQARYYDPLIGRFYSNDPVGYSSENPVMSFNRYIYVNNNPYKFIDPDGKTAESFFVVGKMYENTMQAVSGAWGDLKQSLDNDVSNATSATSDAIGENAGTAGTILGAVSMHPGAQLLALELNIISDMHNDSVAGTSGSISGALVGAAVEDIMVEGATKMAPGQVKVVAHVVSVAAGLVSSGVQTENEAQLKDVELEDNK